MRFRRVVARYPQSGYCDDALLAVGDLYREMARRFQAARYDDDAVAGLPQRWSPSTRAAAMGEKALFAVFEIARRRGDRKRAGRGRRAPTSRPSPTRARGREVKAHAQEARAASQEASLPSPPPPGLAQVFNLRFWSGESSTRVVLDVEKQVQLQLRPHRRPRPAVDRPRRARACIPNLADRSFPVGDGLLEQVRVGQNRDDVVRVVLDFKDVKDHSVFYLQNPTAPGGRRARDAARRMASAAAAPAPPGPSRSSPAVDAVPRAAAVARRRAGRPPRPSPASTRAAAARGRGSRRRRRRDPSPAPRRPPPRPRRDRGHRAAPAPARAAAARRPRRARAGAARAAPGANRAGSYSLARQLGLGARRIVIDAGHGGHDPGTHRPRRPAGEGPRARRGAARWRSWCATELGAEVVMTRATDVFIPLEERTAIANSQGRRPLPLHPRQQQPQPQRPRASRPTS